ncbi:IclR family transcriptional regulator [Antarcticimicrobium luteum]|uniref:IclR family transcriptional regulator n=1 Tax=Antarcticimicrobium luteum TaxID=2547397 RepID=A0A4R5VGI0_9RHOB|nr:IclR family transcriptional regulator [Antarcticimicrobium luteum]TDK52388.1 IclR family transcriptional regulator [Antarcticimicrobium luteum]
MGRTEKPKQNTLYVGSLAKGLRLLRAFDESHTELSLSELAARSGLDKSAAQRLANTLHLEGMLEKDATTRRFRPSHAWLGMAYAYYWSDPLVAQAMPKLIELSKLIGETVNMAELSGDHIIYVSRLPCKRTSFAATVIGRRLPALSTSSGRVILSTFPPEERAAAVRDWPLRSYTPHTTLDRSEIVQAVEQAVRDGYAIARSQMLPNEIAIACPIRNPEGRALAAVQASVSALSWSEERIRAEILPALQDTAHAITAKPQR